MPFYAVFQSTAFVLVLQILVVASAGLAFFALQLRLGLEPGGLFGGDAGPRPGGPRDRNRQAYSARARVA